MTRTLVATCYTCGPAIEHSPDDVITVTHEFRVNGSYEQAYARYNTWLTQARAELESNERLRDSYLERNLREWEAYDSDRLRIMIARHYMPSTHENRETTVCMDHTSACEWCGDPYMIPPAGDLYHWRTHAEQYGAEGVIMWTFSDSLCRTCADDARECDGCNELYNGDLMFYLDYDDNHYCQSCYDECTFYCEFCNWRVNNSHDLDECADEHDAEYDGGSTSGGIHSYSYKPRPLFFDKSDEGSQSYHNDTPYMGFELEVEFGSETRITDAADKMESMLGTHAYLKADGSIVRGFEIVTHPHTLNAYHNHFDWSFLDWASSNGGLSWRTDTCGLHVHISRSSFRSLVHQALFTYLIQNNEEQMVRLAGRRTHWAKFGEGDAPVLKKVKVGQAWDRYQAVNMLNVSTVEVRIFKGSLMKRRILMALELVNACHEYTRLMTVNDFVRGNTSWDAFAKWVQTRKEYDNLNYYIRLYRLYHNDTATTN